MPFDPVKVPGFLQAGAENFSGKAEEITPHDTNDQTTPGGKYFKYFMAATDGDVAFVPMMNDDADAVTVTLGAGQVLQARVRIIKATGTTATVIGFWD